jgi:choline dehydrogenase-like flavoprotein
MFYVVGSGPAGLACSMALLRKGHGVTMLDAGLELESDRKNLVESLRAMPPENWSAIMLAKIKENMHADASGVPLKYVYGSDFPYRETSRYIPIESEDGGIVPSFAKGGLSNVWGATLLPYTAEELKTWPISLETLKPYYQKILEMLPVSAVKDDLDSILPLYSNQLQTLNPSRQASGFMADLVKSQERLSLNNIYFGRSRLAVSSEETDKKKCIYCGLCMYGCPYGLIYNSGDRIDDLRRFENFHYQPGVVVKKLLEKRDEVRIELEELRKNRKTELKGEKVFLACGTVSTTKILLDLAEAYDTPLEMKDAQYFLFPLLRFQKTSNLAGEKLHTLSQIFIEILSPEVSPKRVHLQIYTYSDLFQVSIRKSLSLLYYPLKPLVGEFVERLLIVQGYLHSEDSSRISIKLSRNGKLGLSVIQNETVSQTVRKILRKLRRHKSHLKAIPVSPLVKIAKPGRGFHAGGTFPMRENPQRFQTDVLGRPHGFRRIHAVDATIFPDIPSGPITLTAMANAYRIGNDHDLGA